MLAGWVQAVPQPADERLATERPAVFWGRGDRDGIINADAIERTSQWLPAHSSLTERVYPGLAHGVSDQEIADVRDFLTKRLRGELSVNRGRDPLTSSRFSMIMGLLWCYRTHFDP